MTQPLEIRVAHSPDSDDAFMFYGLATGGVRSDDFRFTHILSDIETLNRKAMSGEYEVTAISVHAYAYVAGKYALLPSGASMGDRYGPLVVARHPCTIEDLRCRKIAVPGLMTTAYLALKLRDPELDTEVMPFDRIMGAVISGDSEAGLLIHEGQLTYAAEGLHKVVDLGEWWFERTGLPLPLGGNAIRRDLGAERIRRISALVKASIRYGLEHRKEALDYALGYARGLDPAQADRFVGMYVNERTLDYGLEGREAVRRLLAEAWAHRLIPCPVEPEFTE